MHVSDAVVERLVANGIDTVFGIPGKQTLPLNEYIDKRDDIRFVVARHETAVSHQAWGYAESSGRLAATLVVPGPGDMNAMNGLKNALNDSVPLLHLSVETEPELRGGDAIHETPPDTYDNVVKENVTVETPQSAAAELDRAIAVAMTPPMGPVRVGIPKSFLPMDVAIAGTRSHSREASISVPEADLDAAVDLLSDADAPLIVAGGGIRAADARAELRQVAERLGAPVVTTKKGKGAFPEDHDLSAGLITAAHPTLRECIADSDGVLAVGTDLDAVETGAWSLPLPASLVHVTLDADDIGRGYDPAVSIAGDARTVLEALDEGLDRRGVEGDGGAERAGAVRRARDDRLAELHAETDPLLNSVSVISAARDVLPRDAIVTADAGGLRLWTVLAFEAYDPRRYVNPGSWATMGTALPSAIGAQLANPDADVMALVGDGGLMMAVHELHTAAAEEVPVVTVVCNNDDYAIISEEAARSFGQPPQVYGWGHETIDFVALAESMGVHATRAETADEFRDALAAALDSPNPELIEVPTDPDEPQAGVWMTE